MPTSSSTPSFPQQDAHGRPMPVEQLVSNCDAAGSLAASGLWRQIFVCRVRFDTHQLYLSYPSGQFFSITLNLGKEFISVKKPPVSAEGPERPH